LNAEKFASLALLDGHPYPQEEMNRAWKRLLFDHFHDIMPGSGVGVNYLDARRNLRDVRRTGREIIDQSIAEIAAHINTQGGGVPVLVFNPLSWARNDVVGAEAQLPGPAKQIEVTDAAGKPAQSQLLSIDPETHRAHFLLFASTPAFGYNIYFVRSATTPAPLNSSLMATGDTLENEFIFMKVDPQTGCVTSLIDKRSKQEALAPSETDTGGPKNAICGNLLQAFVDKPKQWDAWNIDSDFENQ
jgi:alpha-mannosidase